MFKADGPNSDPELNFHQLLQPSFTVFHPDDGLFSSTAGKNARRSQMGRLNRGLANYLRVRDN